MYDTENGFWPLGDVAFKATTNDLTESAQALYAEAWHADQERAEILRATAAWYLDFGHDLSAIRSLPEAPEYQRRDVF